MEGPALVARELGADLGVLVHGVVVRDDVDHLVGRDRRGGLMQKHLMIAINWYGPYLDIASARDAAQADYDHGLYMCIGMAAYQRKASIQYIGIGGKLHRRINAHHHKISKIKRSLNIWLGEVDTAEPSGKRMKVTRTSLDCAEWLHARFMDLPLNEKKTKSPPDRSVTVLNRWWKPDYVTIRKHRPHPEWPDIIDFPGYELPARTVWFGGKQRYFTFPEYGL